MKIGLFAPLGSLNASADLLRTLGAEAEGRGFESIWVAEHVVMYDDYESTYPYSDTGRFPGGADTGLLEPLTALTYLAAVTDPIYTAKQVVDLDVLSGGRVDFGIGVGWLKEEFDAVAAPFAKRGARTDAYLEIMKGLWSDGAAEHRSEFYDLAPTSMHPKPVQRPHPPIHVGGESDAAMRRVARHGQGWYSFNRLPEQLDEPLARLDAVLAEHGRSRADIELTVSPYFNPVDAATVEAFRARGVDRLVLLCFAFDVDGVRATLDELQPLLDAAGAPGPRG
jgi:probable F420-dependent oxidoreductase